MTIQEYCTWSSPSAQLPWRDRAAIRKGEKLQATIDDMVEADQRIKNGEEAPVRVADCVS